MSWGHFIHFVHSTLKALPKLDKPKDPTTAAILGFLFGPVGLGIYFKSFLDFFISLGLLILMTILIPGVGIVPGWIFSAAFGYFRAEASH